MALSENDHELLVRYLDEELDAGDRATLEGRLQQEPPLREGLDRLQLATGALHWNALQQQVAAARAQHGEAEQARKPPRRLPWLRYGLSAAAVLLLVLIGSRVLQQTPDPKALYAQHFVEYKPAQMRGSDTSDAPAQAYEAGNYRRVTEAVMQARQRGTTGISPEQYLQAGLAAMHLEDWPTALLFLNELTQTSYREDADFYRALVFLRTKRYAEARQILEQIYQAPAHLYHRQVDERFISALRRLER